MNLNDAFFEFIQNHLKDDVRRLSLSMHNHHTGFDTSFAITQIECRKKFEKKLPFFNNYSRFIYPSVLSGEQATNQYVARYHADAVDGTPDVLDMTAGLGIDSMTLSMKGCRVTSVELDETKANWLKYNSGILGLKQFEVCCGDSTLLLDKLNIREDSIIFIDPHRRDKTGGRVYGLKDCIPDVTELLDKWKAIGTTIYLKLSPMLDITKVLADLPGTEYIAAVCFKGECKELFVKMSPAKIKDSEVMLQAVDLNETGQISEFKCSESFAKVPSALLDRPESVEEGHYLYIPNAAMMKLGAWGAICARFPGLLKLAAATPLFTSMWYYRSFPGRVLRIDSLPDSRELKAMKGQNINTVARNYPLTAEQLRKKYGLKDGGDNYLIGAKAGLKSKPVLLLCSPVRED